MERRKALDAMLRKTPRPNGPLPVALSVAGDRDAVLTDTTCVVARDAELRMAGIGDTGEMYLATPRESRCSHPLFLPT